MIVIGEKINASIKKTRRAIEEKDGEYLRDLAKRQVEAGSDCLDVNVGTGKDEIENMKWIIKEIESVVSVPLAIDTADEAVMEAALRTLNTGVPIINSISAEENMLKRFLPYIKEYKTQVIALAMGKEGVPKDMETRLKNCAIISNECQKMGIDMEDIFFDPLLVPQATDQTQVLITLKTIKKIKEEFPKSRTCLGLSNISFGLPLRKLINSTFIAMAISRDLDAAILDPLDKKLMSVIKTAEMLMAKDKFCKGYIKAFRTEKLVY